MRLSAHKHFKNHQCKLKTKICSLKDTKVCNNSAVDFCHFFFFFSINPLIHCEARARHGDRISCNVGGQISGVDLCC